MTGSLDAGSWQFAKTVPEPTKLQERCKMEFQSLSWTGSQVLISLFCGQATTAWGHGITWL